MTVMDHEQAERTYAVERYALRDMSLEEAEQFELHFFACPACAAELETVRALAVNGRQVTAGKPMAWWPLATAAGWVIAGVLGWQQFGRTPAPEALATFPLRTVSRGEPNAVVVPAGVKRFAVYLDLVWEARPTAYQIDLPGASPARFTVPAPTPGQPLYVVLERSSLAPGRHQLTVSDPAGQRLADLEFELQIQIVTSH